MIFKSIHIQYFRNYEESELELGREVNIFSGPNGAGKTNILEALYLINLCKSFRAERDADMIKHGEKEAIVAGVTDDGRRTGVRVTGAGKKFYLDGLETRTSRIVSLSRTVLVLADDLHMVSGPPVLRRQTVNVMLGQKDQEYYGLLQEYGKLLKQRSSYLRKAAGAVIPEMVETYDMMLAEKAWEIEEKRKKTVVDFSRTVSDNYRLITGGKEKLELRLLQDVEGSGEDFRKKMLELNGRAWKRGDFSSRGPHRDDILFILDGIPARHHASRGQMKSIALAVRLAQAAYLADDNCSALILIDDISQEIDSARLRNFITGLPAKSQVLITTVDSKFIPLVNSRELCYFNVAEGRVEKVA